MQVPAPLVTTIGLAARRAGVVIQTIGCYERHELMPASMRALSGARHSRLVLRPKADAGPWCRQSRNPP